MSSPSWWRTWKARLSDRRLRQSTRKLGELLDRIPAEVPATRDLRYAELRGVAQAILDGSLPRGIATSVLASFEAAQRQAGSALAEPRVPNFAILAGLFTAIDRQGPLAVLAQAVLSTRLWLTPGRIRDVLVRACAAVEWDREPPAMEWVAALQAAMRLKPSLAIWRRLLGEMARLGQWPQIWADARRHRYYRYTAKRALSRKEAPGRRPSSALAGDALLAAELIARAGGETGLFDAGLAGQWLLPLVERSTGRYLPRLRAALWLCERLTRKGPVSAADLAGAMERGIAPAGPEDYSNFRFAFSADTWEILHSALHSWGVLSELEAFACEHDRARFWHHFDRKGVNQ